MAETRYCYVCHCKRNEDVKMEFYPKKSIFGTYECPKCPHVVDKKVSGDTGEKYIQERYDFGVPYSMELRVIYMQFHQFYINPD